MNCAAYNHFVRIIFVTVLLFTAVGASITSEEKSPTAPLGFQADDRDDGTWVHLSAVQLKTLKSMKGFFVESEDVTADLERNSTNLAEDRLVCSNISASSSRKLKNMSFSTKVLLIMACLLKVVSEKGRHSTRVQIPKGLSSNPAVSIIKTARFHRRT